MGRAKIIKRQGRCFIELPPAFGSSEEAEVFELRDGFFLISTPLEQVKAGKPVEKTAVKEPGSEEILLLRKLSSIKFNERTPENVERIFDAREKELLEKVLEKGWATLFKGRKYKNGVYNIPDNVYPLLRGKKADMVKAPLKEEKKEAADTVREELEKKGYLVIRNQQEAKMLSEKLKEDLKAKSLAGIKGFDGMFYLVTKEFISGKGKAVLDFLAREADVKSIAHACGIDMDGVNALLNHLAESGDIIEKKKGVYIAV